MGRTRISVTTTRAGIVALLTLAVGCGDGLSGWFGDEPPPSVTSHPSDQTVTEGQTATFNVTATGSGTLTYQWKKNGIDVTGGTGGTTASHTTPATTLADSGAQFTCVVTNPGGSVTSNPATLTVTSPITLTLQRFAVDSVQLTWTDSFGNEDGFRVYRSEDGGAFSQITADLPADTTTYNDSTTVVGVKYVYYVATVVAAAERDTSNQATADYVKILTPSNGETLTIGDMYDMTWEEHLSIGSDWVLRASTDGGSSWEVICDSGATSPFAWKVGYRSSGGVPNQVQFVTGTETNCVIQIADYGNVPFLVDLSDGTFTMGLLVPQGWTYVSGSSEVDQNGIYGTKGVADAANAPGARKWAISWVDGSGDLWVFGGRGFGESNVVAGDLNDLWRFDGTNWIWMTGDKDPNQSGTYGALGTFAAANTPGARYGSVAWVDANADLWLFGGYGKDSAGSTGQLNDLWRFDVTLGQWAWENGSNSIVARGEYTTPPLVPGARVDAVGCTDSNGDLWLFGGYGYDSSTSGLLNDLWMYDVSSDTWSHEAGGSSVYQPATYGTKGVEDAANVPASRRGSTCGIDASDNLWFFGGEDRDGASGPWRRLNDLWRYRPTTGHWTWVSGTNTPNDPGTYGTQGVADPANAPRSRRFGAAWMATGGAMWVFCGEGSNQSTLYNDLCKCDGANWTWVSGTTSTTTTGSYTAPVHPGSRSGPASCRDASGYFWLFGGYGNGDAAASNPGYLNDLWRYVP